MIRLKRKEIDSKKINEEGTAVFEFVLVLPMMFIMIAFIVDMGQMMMAQSANYIGAYTASREAMVPNANVAVAEIDGEKIVSEAPFGLDNQGNIMCQRGSSLTTCTAQGIVNFSFPIPFIHNSLLSNQWSYRVPVSLPTEN